MNFTHEMIAALAPPERLMLKLLYDKVQEPKVAVSTPPWQWVMQGPAASNPPTIVLNPLQKVGKERGEECPREVPASSGRHGSLASWPSQRQLIPTE